MSRWLFFLVFFIAVHRATTELRSEIVTAYTLDGARVDGRLTDCRDSKVVIETKSGPVELTFGTLDRIELVNTSRVSSTAEATQIVTLVDGSTIACQSFIGRDDRWTAKSASGLAWEFPKGCVESLLMSSPSTALKSEWMKATAELRTSDEMVIARRGDTMDRASGMVVEMTPDSVEFSFDGQFLQAPRVKLLGLLWFRPQEKRVEPAIQVRMVDGSRWEASTISINSINQTAAASIQGLRWTTPCGVEASAPWIEIEEINFSSANVVWLASQTALTKKTYQRSLLHETISGRDDLLGPRFFSADGSEEAKSQDLQFSGPGEIAFRIPTGFHRFVTKIRRSDKTRFATTVQCQVWVGESLAWDATLTHDQLEAVVDIPVVSEKRLRIVVACESDLLLGTQLSWQQPRLTR